MPKLVYGQSDLTISVPAGRYRVKFLGTEDREPIQDSKWGKGEQPRMAWIFEVVEGPKAGEKIPQETGTRAVPRSGCARVLAGLCGGSVNPGQAVDTDQFIGKLYDVKVAPNPNSDKGNLYVADIEPHQGGGQPSVTAGAAPAAKPPAGGPPPRRPAQQQPAKPHASQNGANWWLDAGDGNTTLATSDAVRAFIFEKGVPAKDLQLCPEKGNEQDWKSAAEYGFEDCPI